MGMRTRPARRFVARAVIGLFAVAVLTAGCGSEVDSERAAAKEACLAAGWSWLPADLWLTPEEPDPCVNPNAPWPESPTTTTDAPVSTTVAPATTVPTPPTTVQIGRAHV